MSFFTQDHLRINRMNHFLKDKAPTDAAFNFPHLSNASVMVEKDLAEAGIPYSDDAGQDIDFHALRHTFITHLAMSGVLPSVCQEMARHSDVNITMRYYTHILRQSKVDAIAALENSTHTYPNQATNITSVDAGGRKKVG